MNIDYLADAKAGELTHQEIPYFSNIERVGRPSPADDYVEIMNQGMAWLDTGTFDSLYEASAFIHTLEKRQGIKVGCPEEVSWRKGWISSDKLEELAFLHNKSGYGSYLSNLINQEII